MLSFHEFLSETLLKLTHPVTYFYSDKFSLGKSVIKIRDSVLDCEWLNSWDKTDLFASEIRGQNTQLRGSALGWDGELAPEGRSLAAFQWVALTPTQTASRLFARWGMRVKDRQATRRVNPHATQLCVQNCQNCGGNKTMLVMKERT